MFINYHYSVREISQTPILAMLVNDCCGVAFYFIFLRNCSNYISSFSEDKGSLVKGFSGNVDCINMLEVLFAFWCCELKNKNVCGSRCSWSNKGSHKCDNSNFSFKKLKSSCYMS